MTALNLIVGMKRSEDADVHKLIDDLAIGQTVDFFTAVVDEPYQFGQIAVANALSDVSVKGNRPLTAVNIFCFPTKTTAISLLREILASGLDKMHEVSVLLVGGHSGEDKELKYGLSITGIVHPSRVIRNTRCKIGYQLILTKSLGVGSEYIPS